MKLEIIWRVLCIGSDNKTWHEVDSFSSKAEALNYILTEGKDFEDELLKIEETYLWSNPSK